MRFFFIALESIYYINFHTSTRNWEEIQNDNNGKHEAVVIKYLVQRIKTLENSNKKVNERLKNCTCFQPVHKKILKNDENVMFYTGIPKLSILLNLCGFMPHLLSENGVMKNQQGNLAVDLSNQI